MTKFRTLALLRLLLPLVAFAGIEAVGNVPATA